MYLKAAAVAAVLLSSLAGVTGAETLHFTATLRGSDEVPPNTTGGKGEVSATLNTTTKVLDYTAIYTGLTGPATAAHFNEPAAPGSIAPPIIPMTNLASPIEGTRAVTDVQIGDLTAGMWYFNIHTAAHPGGEIRGQLKAAL